MGSDIGKWMHDLWCSGAGWLGLGATLLWAIPHKSIQWQVDSVTPIINHRPSGPELQVSLGGQSVHNPHLLRARWMLAGNRGIQESAYNKGPALCFSGRSFSIKDAWLQQPDGTKFPLEVGEEPHRVFEEIHRAFFVAVPTMPLNPGDHLHISIITEGRPDYAWATGHVLDCAIAVDRSRFLPDLIQAAAFIWTLDIFMWYFDWFRGNVTILCWTISLLTWWSASIAKGIYRLMRQNKPEELRGLKLLASAPVMAETEPADMPTVTVEASTPQGIRTTN